MLPTRNGAIRLFQISGISVFLHWSWFVVAIWDFQNRSRHYSSPLWNIAEYLSLFGLVLMHEFGHSLSCRQVGGRADQIVLWPLGGVAYVSPPQRPGAQLWSIAAGPLVNVGVFLLFGALQLVGVLPDAHATDFGRYVDAVRTINSTLLIFNLLPIYPLDGGQILQSLLWFVVGQARSIYVAASLGFLGAVLLAGFAAYLYLDDPQNGGNALWFAVIAFFIFSNCRRGWIYARSLAAVA